MTIRDAAIVYPLCGAVQRLCGAVVPRAVLPVADRAGGGADPETGAPLNPMLGKKALFATGIAAVLWVGFYFAIGFGWLEL